MNANHYFLVLILILSVVGCNHPQNKNMEIVQKKVSINKERMDKERDKDRKRCNIFIYNLVDKEINNEDI